ncbi:hypothetical protein KZ820_11300 [Sphingomonas sp. RRHST34]|uniref:Uncharacterized protein n=1 Tax=Sphingomonas citri TaxID=2862499 RepID=A0ABS7BP33_9SPHN|nr:hypothetical protein [Sphingomonas citri]MBW6531321.1 hypothetical protein [Sphingomonas citri]
MANGLRQRDYPVAPSPHHFGNSDAAIEPRGRRSADGVGGLSEAEEGRAGWRRALARFVDIELLLMILFVGLPSLALCVLSSE